MWFAYTLLGLVALIALTYMMLLGGFWRKVARNPGLAMRFFLTQPEWAVEGGVTPPRAGMSGPFLVRVDDVVFTVFGRGDYRTSQGYFYAFVRDYERAVRAGHAERVPDDSESLLGWLEESRPSDASRLRHELNMLQATYVGI